MAGTLPGGQEAIARAGLLTAMRLGEPPNSGDKPTFIVPATGDPVYTRDAVTLDPEDVNVDASGKPLDPTVQVTYPEPTHVQIPIAVEFTAVTNQQEIPVGSFRPTKVAITILDYDENGNALYDQVKDATDIILGGDTYMLAYEQPPVGLGAITVYTMIGFARQES